MKIDALTTLSILLLTGAVGFSTAATAANVSYAAVTSKGKFPNKCPDAADDKSGVCFLVSTVPSASAGGFEIYTPEGRYVDDAYGNSVRNLKPGDYLGYSTLDGQHAVKFTVTAGKVTNIKTATLVNSTRVLAEIQNGHDVDNGSTCTDQSFDVLYTHDAYSLLPGSYVVDLGNPEDDLCADHELEISLSAGQVMRVRTVR